MAVASRSRDPLVPVPHALRCETRQRRTSDESKRRRASASPPQ
jgi:hypothetical protein